METFFGRLKTEMFYGHEKDFESFEKFSKAINEYIDYYNNKRIQSKTNWMPPAERESLRQYNQGLAYEVPVTFAKLSRVPIVHANHCGIVTAYNFPNADKLQTRQFVGAAQIVDGTGQVLARRNFFEGGGFVIADILLNTTCQKTEKIFPDKYWIPDLPDSYIQAWDTINPKGKHYYNTVALPYYQN